MTSRFSVTASNKPPTLSERIKKKNLNYNNSNIVYFSNELSEQEINKILGFVDQANDIIKRHFGVYSTFDLVVCKGGLEMQTQIMPKMRGNRILQRQQQQEQEQEQEQNPRKISKLVAMTDYELEETIIRYDVANFGNYLRELILGILDRSHTHQLREALAWYYTLKLTEQHKYVRPSYATWIDHLYVTPVKRLANIVGDDFLRDLALGRGSIEENAFPIDIKRLFSSEKMFYC
jgi:hypothetical protein